MIKWKQIIINLSSATRLLREKTSWEPKYYYFEFLGIFNQLKFEFEFIY